MDSSAFLVISELVFVQIYKNQQPYQTLSKNTNAHLGKVIAHNAVFIYLWGMKKIGILSDTHGCFDASLREFFCDVDEIWHAGDFGSIEIADQIAAFKPLRGVFGNIDGGVTRVAYREFEAFECEGVRVLITHIGGFPGRYDPRAYAKIRQICPTLFICGHSHILRVGYDKANSLLHINPGAAGKSGFHNVRTAVRLQIDGQKMSELEVWEAPRVSSTH